MNLKNTRLSRSDLDIYSTSIPIPIIGFEPSTGFVGEQVKGGPGWAIRNSGLMLHGQTPESMTVDQDFPVSIEAQILGGNGTDARSTMNLCTPGTNVFMNGELILAHCTDSSSETYHGDQWVTAEAEVYGNETIRHFVNGTEVLFYEASFDRRREAQRP